MCGARQFFYCSANTLRTGMFPLHCCSPGSGLVGIVHAIRTQDDMQEASGAYKDIDQVIANEADLVSIVTRLLLIAVIKG